MSNSPRILSDEEAKALLLKWAAILLLRGATRDTERGER